MARLSPGQFRGKCLPSQERFAEENPMSQVPSAASVQPSAALAGKTVLIFGGTSGIGLAAARQAKAAGASVTVVGFDAAGAERVAAEESFTGWRGADVTKPDAITAAVADVR